MADSDRTAKTVIPSNVPTTELLIHDKKLPDRRGYVKIEGIDPRDGRVWDIRISEQRISQLALRGMGAAKELAHIVPWVLRHPTAIYQGIREDGEDEWLCYCSVPQKSFRTATGYEAPPYPNEVFLVFVNADRVAYNHRWEKADPGDPKQPMNHEERFHRRLLP